MKKVYIAPRIVVEDFTVSEMVAKNCALNIDKIHFVMEANSNYPSGQGPCEDGREDFLDANKYPDANNVWNVELQHLYDGWYDVDKKGGNDYVFTEEFYKKSGNNHYICSYYDVDNMSFIDQITGSYNCKLGDDVTDVNMNS